MNPNDATYYRFWLWVALGAGVWGAAVLGVLLRIAVAVIELSRK